LERANLGAVGLAVDLRLPRGFVCQTRRGRRQFAALGQSPLATSTGTAYSFNFVLLEAMLEALE
jgi:hypothetical protein